MEAQYAPPGHPVFELVPQVFHEHVSNLYTTIGKPEVTIDTFWERFRHLLKCLRGRLDEQLTGIITSYDITPAPEPMPILPNMEAFRLGRPLDLGTKINYIGGLDGSMGPSPSPEYADFTDKDDDESDSEDEVE